MKTVVGSVVTPAGSVDVAMTAERPELVFNRSEDVVLDETVAAGSELGGDRPAERSEVVSEGPSNASRSGGGAPSSRKHRCFAERKRAR